MHGSPAVPTRRLLLASLLLAAVLPACGATDGGAPVASPTPAAGRSTTGPPPAASSPGSSPSTSASVGGPTGPESDPAKDSALDRALVRAAARGDDVRVASLLARGASVRTRDGRGRTALVAAAYGNHLASARVLVDAGADVNRQDRTRQSAYLISTSEVGDDPRLLDLTLASGADVASLDSFEGTGLIRAADRGHVRIVRRLLRTDVRVDHVNNLGWTALHEAVILGDGSRRYVRTVEALVGAGADVNKPSLRDGIRPLQHAQARGYTRVAGVLRAAGAR